jgi:iron-sulfur cluster repair protein YtfE (RIC family)
MNLSATRTVRELAIEIPNATRTFEKLGIDYCCGGGKSLSDACMHAHLPVDDVLRALEQGGNFTPRSHVFSSFCTRWFPSMERTIQNWAGSSRHSSPWPLS